MKLLMVLVVFSLAASFAEAFLPSLTFVALASSFSQPVDCFFGIFRRRRPVPSFTIEDSAPEGPVSFESDFSESKEMSSFSPGSSAGSASNLRPFYNAPPSTLLDQNRFSQNNRFQNQFSEADIQALQQQSMQSFSSQQSMQFPQGAYPDTQSSNSFSDDSNDVPPGMNTEEAESFFTLLAETDESECISRLVCEMGANPSTGGEFGQTIVDIIGSLTDFPAGSKVSKYNDVLTLGRTRGTAACLSQYAACDEESFQLVKKAQVDDGSENGDN